MLSIYNSNIVQSEQIVYNVVLNSSAILDSFVFEKTVMLFLITLLMNLCEI